jgi:hypothetical protein
MEEVAANECNKARLKWLEALLDKAEQELTKDIGYPGNISAQHPHDEDPPV